MGAVPTPTTQTAGLVVPAATINSQGNLATYLAGRTESGGSRKPLCNMQQAVVQSIPNNTNTAITFDAEDVDYDNGHSTVTNTSRYTANTAGWHLLTYGASFTGNNTGIRGAWLRTNGPTGTSQNGSATDYQQSTPGDITVITGSCLLFLNVTDYVELLVFQSCGAALNTYTSQYRCRMGVILVSV